MGLWIFLWRVVFSLGLTPLPLELMGFSSPVLAEYFTLFSQKRLPRVLSDHFPIFLESGSHRRGRIPFRFENMWLKAEGFLDKVKFWWENYHFQGTPSYILAKKLTALKSDLKKWNETDFGNIADKKQLL